MGRGRRPAKDKAKPAVPRKSPGDQAATVPDLEKRQAEALEREAEALKREAEAREQLQTRDRELVEERDQRKATAEILRVISQSPSEMRPVFQAIVDSAVKLCDAAFGGLIRWDGGLMTIGAISSQTRPAERGAFEEIYPLPVTPRARLVGLAIREKRVVQIDDVQAEPDVLSAAQNRRLVQAQGYRTFLAVPLLRGDVCFGAISLWRRVVVPFSEQHIALLQTFAEQAVIAIENVRLFNETKEALERQTATSEILRVISASPTDVQPVFDAIAESAVRLCDGVFGGVFRFDGDLLHPVAQYRFSPEASELIRRQYPMRPRGLVALALEQGIVIQSADVLNDPRSANPELARTLGYRSLVNVPMLRGDQRIGAICVYGTETKPFSEKQIALLQTFADQAVIAIENVRLFKELEARNSDLTATSEILQVISRSPTDTQPVFETIADNAMRLFRPWSVAVYRFDGELIHVAAARGGLRGSDQYLREQGPRRPTRDFMAGRCIVDRSVVHVRDFDTDVDVPATAREIARRRGFKATITVPMLRDRQPIGVISVSRTESGGFSQTEIDLLKTFADQAGIAIENVRLFNETKEALDRQTATAEILRVISQAQTDVQPVFDAIVRSASRLFGGAGVTLFRYDGGLVHHQANYGASPEKLERVLALWPRPINDSATSIVTAIRTGSVLQDPDTEDPSAHSALREVGRTLGFRSQVTVPMLRGSESIGAITVTRSERGAFDETQIELLKTFADQAVIAIENARLLRELQARTAELTRSVGELRALGEVGQAISSTLDLETVLTTIVSRAVQLTGMDGGVVFEYDELAEEFVQRAAAETGGVLAVARRGVRYRKGEGALGRTAITLEPVQVGDITVPGAYESRVRENLIASGVRAILAVPMVREGHLIGCLGVTRNHPGDFPSETIKLLQTFATQSALAIQNARLFLEIEDKSRQLEAASQHKSEFLANMSHELRTPLNAIIGFSEVLSEKMFGELNEKQEEYSKDIHASGQHLLSLINDILDLSKIEAGRMELELTEFDLPMAIDGAAMLVRERAGRRNIVLHTEMDPQLGQIQADERKVRQVVLNLLANAIKFTPEGGRIEVGAVPKDGFVEVSVSDTGIGIAPEDQEKVFEEFRQVGTAAKKVEGTGLGLTLCRKFVELHGGKIWVKSQLGAGSTFTFTIPVHPGE